MIELAPFFSLARAEWIPRLLTWDAETGFFERMDGPGDVLPGPFFFSEAYTVKNRGRH